MATQKGYSSNQKLDRLTSEFVTVSPSGPFKMALDVRDVGSVSVFATDAVEASSTVSVINATAHVALVGDRLRFTSGVNQQIEVDVWAKSTNSITLGQDLPNVPGVGDTFQILRPTSVTVSSSGSAGGSVTFTRDGVDQIVTEDTVTPANNRPLPVKIVDLNGDINITAGDINVALDQATDSVKIGDGTDLLAITAAGEALVKVNTALPAGTNNIGDVDVVTQPARSHTTDSIKVGDGTDFLEVNADGSINATVSATNLDIRDLSASQDNIKISDGVDSLEITASGEALVKVNSALPAGTNAIGKLAANDGIDIGDVTINNAAGASAVNIQDGGNSITVDGAVAATQSGTWNIGTLSTITNVVHVDDNAGSLTVDGTVAATQSGSWAVQVNNAAGASAVNIQDGGNSITVDGSVTVTQATGTNLHTVLDSGTLTSITNVVHVDDNSGSLTVDGTVAATQSGSWSVGVNNAAGASAVNIQDGGNSITVDGTVAATQSGTWNIGTLTSITNAVTIQDGGNVISVDDAGGSLTVDGTVAATQSGSWTVTTNTLDVVDLLDANVLDTSSTNINGSAGAFVQVVASLAANVKKLQILDTTGGFIGLYTGAPASEVLKLVIGPGSDQTIEATIASGTRISVRRLDSTSALTSGILAVNFLG